MAEIDRLDTSPESAAADQAEMAPPRSAADVLYLVTTIGSPIALGTALLVYFGWVRTKVQTQALGYDSSILDFSTTDYILKSINVLSVPLALLLIVALALTGMHQHMVVPASKRVQSRAILLHLARLLRMSWILWGLVGIVLLPLVAPAPRGFVIPISLTLSLLCAVYGRTLQKKLADVEPWSSANKMLVVALLTFAVLWDAERVARTMGEGFAAQIAADPQELIAVTVYSTKSLGIDAPGVLEEKSSRGDTQYPYSYKGLRLLERSGSRYFLINDQWDKNQGRVIVLPETDNIRMEFSHHQSPG
jgi:hypothetical protein